MKGLIVYSSNTGNTKKLAEGIYNTLKQQADWKIEDIKNVSDTSEYDTILLGSWVENATLDRKSINFLDKLDKENKKIGLFITMGSRTSTKHGKLCEQNLMTLVGDKYSLGHQIVQGKISEALMERLENLPDTALPKTVKKAMKDGFEHYTAPTEEIYKKVADYFANQLV